MSLCFCASIPQIDNRTNFLLLQHVGERFHPFNTARIVHKSLRRCRLIADHCEGFGSRCLPIEGKAALLYPHRNAMPLASLPMSQRPEQLVIVDGTWHQAKTIVRDVPQLQGLPCYRLTPSMPGRYRIRLEPNAQSLSTLEATVAALRCLEPSTGGCHQLLAAFDQMVEAQLLRLADQTVRRRKRIESNRPRDLPHALSQDLDRVIVAYGEATPGRCGQRAANPLPVNWVALRLATGERFSCRVRQRTPLSTVELARMRLGRTSESEAVSHGEFRSRWHRYLRRDDVLVVYHQRTCQLLKNIGATQPKALVLKSIFRKQQPNAGTLEDLVANQRLTLPTTKGETRADQRLEMAVALVQHLSTQQKL